MISASMYHMRGRLISVLAISLPLILWSPLSQASDVVWDSKELLIGTQSGAAKGLYCNTRATEVLDTHRRHKAQLEPSRPYSPQLTSRALLGLVVQVRGEEYASQDLQYELSLRYRDIEKIYRGSWVYPKHSADKQRRVAAKTTDWWINLEDFFPPSLISAICANNEHFTVQHRSHKFISQ